MSKVLIVDDDHEISGFLDDLLRDEGFSVQTAQNGIAALEILKSDGGWVVLLDLMMPQMDGHEVIRQLRANPDWLDANRVVLMSAGHHLAAINLGTLSDVVLAVVPKPFDFGRLLQVVQQLAAERKGESESPESHPDPHRC
jgi:CheY-like chemotaxis protein